MSEENTVAVTTAMRCKCVVQVQPRLEVPIHQGDTAHVEELVNVIFKCLLVEAHQLGARKDRVVELPEGKSIQPHRPSHPLLSYFLFSFCQSKGIKRKAKCSRLFVLSILR
jgi:hypothetical protein